MKNFAKYFLFVFIILEIAHVAKVNAKPVPPGSGEGDVPANILILIDSSASMRRRMSNRDAIQYVPNAIYDSNGNILAAQFRNNGVVKFNADGSRDREFNDNVGRYTGNVSDSCELSSTGMGYGGSITKNTVARHTADIRFAEELSTDNGVISNEDIFFFRSNDRQLRDDQAIVGYSEDGQDCKMYLELGLTIQAMDYQNIGDEHFLFVTGRVGNTSAFVSFNLNTGQSSGVQQFGGNAVNSFAKFGRLTWRIAVNSDASMLYLGRNDIWGFTMERVGDVYAITDNVAPRVYRRVNNGNLDTQLAPVTAIEVSADDDDILYITSSRRHVIQKVELTTNTTYTILARAGRGRRDNGANIEAAGALAANNVRFNNPVGITVTSDRILVGTTRGTIDVFNENLFTADNRDTAWLLQMGGGNVSRWVGVKKAMSAIISDTTLTSGAHFGYGHWNAGETGGPRTGARGGRWCHFRDGCTYYGGWNGSHPDGQSTQCNRDSCLNVGISAEGYTRILDNLIPQGLAWGTDANAYSIMALDYFNNDFEAYDEDSECQLNYVIVIGDGMMRNNTSAIPRIEALRDKENPVKTLFVAYGGGINTRGMEIFDAMAVAGSCPGGDANSPDCEPTIVADTPESLKTQLTAKIRQILAERLSFTAPSITATVQEGGSLYQAQFAYEQFGEWQGTILRKTLNADGTVVHEVDAPGNWDASVQIKGQASIADAADTRNLWSAIPGSPYIGNWDNFKTDNSDDITELFELFGYNITDYHNSTSYCSTKGYVGDDGTSDDLLGLINFMKGTDYFDYNGDCNVTEVRDHVLGDIYHSQLIEVGPPDASTQFTGANEEAYFRATNNYQGFQQKHASRRNVIYAGANSGILHAINAETGAEEWGFIPPFIAGLLPSIINPDLSGKIDGSKGGTNAIFGVDGSPVVHDVFIKGINEEGELEDQKSWHTILFVPYGRGGAGFSVLDVTNPILKDNLGPIHMFSVFNDAINSTVYMADHEGQITAYPYSSGSVSIQDSLEAKRAGENLDTAFTADGGDNSLDPDHASYCDSSDDPDEIQNCTNQDAIAVCQTNEVATTTNLFHSDALGTASCFKGTKFRFPDLKPKANADGTVPKSSLKVTERVAGTLVTIDFTSASYVNDNLVITFPTEKTYNAGGSPLETAATNQFTIATSCTAAADIPVQYDYSQLGETWSAPRIFRIPSEDIGNRSDSRNDKYVAVMGAGMGATNLCAGSAVFIVNLDRDDESGIEPGTIFGSTSNGGPITIIDTVETNAAVTEEVTTTTENEAGDDVVTTTTVVTKPATSIAGATTPNGSDIGNSLPSSAVVITPDTAFNIPWRGAMVYFNDLEGKITKLNLTSSTKNDADLFDQTTLFRLNADTKNKRYSYFSMDAGIGQTTREFWLFGGTGNFNDIGGGSKKMDNILYGIKDPHYPHFKHLNSVHIPRETEDTFLFDAHTGADNAPSVDDAVICKNTTGNISCDDGPTTGQQAWVVHLDTPDDKGPNEGSTNTFRKLSASPTLFKGQVYFPIYEPPQGANPCNIGNAIICVVDDECGANNSHLLTRGGAANGKNCQFVREGILSELVIFGDKLFANVAGPKEDAETLYSVLAAAGEVEASRGSWRESGF